VALTASEFARPQMAEHKQQTGRIPSNYRCQMAPVEEVAAAAVEAERNSLNQGSLIGHLVPHPFSHGACGRSPAFAQSVDAGLFTKLKIIKRACSEAPLKIDKS